MKKVFSVIVLAVLMATLSITARADIIPEPDNDFYRRNYSVCVPLQRSFYVNGRDGSVALRTEPGSRSEIAEFENGTILFIMFTYNRNGAIWGVTEIWETRQNGWLPMDDLLLVYDYISFAEEHEGEFYTFSNALNALETIPDLIFWTWPGSGVIDSVLESKWRTESEHESIFLAGDKDAYKDEDGREWVFIPYLYGRRNAWICLSDPLNMNIPAFNPAPLPEYWQPGYEYSTPQGGITLPAIVLILVAVVVVATVILIRVFWKKSRM